MHVLYETNLRVGPSPLDGCSLGDFESCSSLRPKFHIDAPLYDFEGDDDISSPFLHMLLLLRSLTLDSPKDISTIPDLPFPPVPLGEPEKREVFEVESSIDKLDSCDELKQFCVV